MVAEKELDCDFRYASDERSMCAWRSTELTENCQSINTRDRYLPAGAEQFSGAGSSTLLYGFPGIELFEKDAAGRRSSTGYLRECPATNKKEQEQKQNTADGKNKTFLGNLTGAAADKAAKLGKDAFYQALYSGELPKIGQLIKKDCLPNLPAVDLTDESKVTRIEKPGDYKQTMVVDGRERTYSIHVPPGYDPKKPMPMMVLLHGIRQDGAEIADMTRMREKADKEGFILVCPDGSKLLGKKDLGFWNVPNWPLPKDAPRVHDNEFVMAAIDRTQKQLAVDDKRIYAVGYSNGGMLAYSLAVEYPDKFAAIAVVDATMTGKEKVPNKALSVLAIRGAIDPVVPVAGLPGSEKVPLPAMASAEQNLDFWRRNNHITAAPECRLVPAGKFVTSVNRETGAEVSQYVLSKAAHSWPGGKTSKIPNSQFSATDKIWEFCAQHRK